LAKGYIRDIPLSLKETEVVALNVTKLRTDIIDPRKYMTRLEEWKKKVEAGTDLLIAKNPNNPYPIYLLLKKSERFSKKELINAFETLNTADTQLKSGGQNPRLVLEKVVLEICKVQGARRKA